MNSQSKNRLDKYMHSLRKKKIRALKKEIRNGSYTVKINSLAKAIFIGRQ